MKKGFTLAEVLITLLIVGIVAALTIPSVIANAQQQEFKTGLKKAVNALNEAITIGIQKDSDNLSNINPVDFLPRHMNIIKINRNWDYKITHGNNMSFYTTDGMRFDLRDANGDLTFPLHENNNVYAGMRSGSYCGSYGLLNNSNKTIQTPCIVVVDVNGDRKPNPIFESKLNERFGNTEYFANYSYPSPSDKKLTDVFPIMLTEDRAIPFGVVAQRAMYSK